MLNDLLPLLPQEVGPGARWFCLVGALVGLIIWIIGARLSRYIIPLTLVAVSTVVGLRLPGWMGWGIDGMAVGVAAAVVMGVLGYLLHPVFVAIALASVLCLWGAVGCWSAMGPEAFAWQTDPSAMALPAMIMQAWRSLPPDFVHVLPFAAVASGAVAMAIAILWPCLSTSLLYSLTGITIVVAMGLVSLRYGFGRWITVIPETLGPQLLILIALVATGALIQTQMEPRVAVDQGPEPDEEDPYQ